MAGAYDYVLFTQLQVGGKTLNLATVDFETFIEYLEYRKQLRNT